MGLIKPAARFFFAIAMIAFGIQHIVYGEFVTRLVPKLPAWIPQHSLWAYVTGLVLIAAGIVIVLLPSAARIVSSLLGVLILLSFFIFYLPLLRVSPPLGGLWTNAGKALALSGGAFLVAASPTQAGIGVIDRRLMIPLSRLFLSAFMILAGVQHFLFASFVATLVPPWIPQHLFWTYFAGVALIAGGIGVLIPRVTRLAALLSGTMILLWVVLLHIPRAIAAPRDANETTAVFEALAIGGTALLIAALDGAGSKSRR
jgi:uncharacterized membrane protein